MAQKKFLTKVISNAADGMPGVVRFMLGNGLEVQAELAEIPENIQKMLILHGLSQKVGDSAAGFSKTLDYSGAFTAMQQVVDNLYAGVWSTRGQGGSGVTDLVAAIAELKGITVGQAQDVVDAMDEETYKKISGHPVIKAKMAELKAIRLSELAKNAPEIDLDLDLDND